MRRILDADTTRKVAAHTIAEIANTVGSTLGPRGQVVMLQQFGQNPDGTPMPPLLTKDGVTVAEHIAYRNPAFNTIAQAMLQVAKNTVNQAGDGTTTAIVLANALYRAGYRHLEQGSNGIELFNDLRAVKDQVVIKLHEMAKPITEKDLYDVALISANGDSEIATKVSEAILAVGEDGHIDLQDGYSKETTLELIDGAMYKQGWRKFAPNGSLMVTNKIKNICELDHPAVLLYAGDIKEPREVSDIIAKIMGMDENAVPKQLIPILFIAYDFSDDVKNHIMQLRVQGKLPIAAIKAPFDGSPNARTQMLEDLAVLLGGKVTARGIIDLKDISDEHLGCAERVEIGPEETVFYQGQGDQEEIMQRVSDLKQHLDTVGFDYDKENLRLRIGKLTGGVAVLKVGGDSEIEMKERKDRIEDALCAAKVAIAEGILPGGGYALYKIAQEMDTSTLAGKIMKEALEAPIRKIISNAGKNPDVILSHMPTGKGYDARRRIYEEMMQARIIDPLKVTRSALENAVSIVGLLLTTGGAIVADTESKDGQANPFAGLMGV
jgi:chaperonin GroEL